MLNVPPFPTTYLCETRLFSCTSTKDINAETGLRIQQSSVKPEMKILVKLSNIAMHHMLTLNGGYCNLNIFLSFHF